jgi:hypothetical protein
MTSRISVCALLASSLLAACSGRPPADAGAARTIPLPVAFATSQAAPAAKEATTIAAVWKGRATLSGKTVTLRGKVVKFNPGILGVNWIHIQDGSGTAADATNDITVTSDAETQVGNEITVTGTVILNRDLGSGYKYPVLIEKATIATGK